MRKELRQRYRIREMRRAGLGYRERSEAIARMKAEDTRKVKPRFVRKKPQVLKATISTTQSTRRASWFKVLINLMKKLWDYLKRGKR